MKASATDSTIRTISLLRRIGSVFVVFIIATLLFFSVYHDVHDRLWITDLKDIYVNGVSTLADVESNYQIVTVNYKPELTFNYSFTEGGEIYQDQYKLPHHLPEDPALLKKIFTVHYLKDDPSENSLNIEEEIKRIDQKIADSSLVWLIIRAVLTVIIGFVLLFQILALVGEIRNISKPIEVPGYLKK
jgi:hypothetical protein